MKSLVLYGDSQSGKTTWARSLGKHVYFEKQFSAKTALDGMEAAEYAVFDDMAGGLAYFPGWKGWLGCQNWVTVKALYRDPTLQKWNKPSIWCTNRDVLAEMRRSVDKDDGKFFTDDLEWMEANCVFIKCNHWDPLVTFPTSNMSQ